MLHSPESIQKQLSDAVSIIGKYDFPNKWPDLINQMVEKFNTGDFYIINGVLYTAHSLFKKYRYEFKSDSLWTEIKFVLDNFAKPLTDLFLVSNCQEINIYNKNIYNNIFPTNNSEQNILQATVNLTQIHANNVEALKVIYNSLVTICKVFFSLNFQVSIFSLFACGM